MQGDSPGVSWWPGSQPNLPLSPPPLPGLPAAADGLWLPRASAGGLPPELELEPPGAGMELSPEGTSGLSSRTLASPSIMVESGYGREWRLPPNFSLS